ncbi:hypothetical protein Ccrd_009126 [Cynara cardunculus var. scolymus]|uniref:Uncharacterized protein n=1 Tax=Cynara cardunculus var. scolymus TaxID=59895 RepID=A0A124SIE5_CYNCS|nr:hypothetical protein Ccrd_009126 [Cynara cardunculus var. scolymus]
MIHNASIITFLIFHYMKILDKFMLITSSDIGSIFLARIQVLVSEITQVNDLKSSQVIVGEPPPNFTVL